MKKMFFQFTSVYAFLLIVAILLLIFKSESSENSYFIARILLFGYSVLTSALLFIPRFIIGLLEKIFKNSVDDLNESLEDSISWPYIVLFVLILCLIILFPSIYGQHICHHFLWIYVSALTSDGFPFSCPVFKIRNYKISRPANRHCIPYPCDSKPRRQCHGHDHTNA
mgnify:CR=1 FL=1